MGVEMESEVEPSTPRPTPRNLAHARKPPRSVHLIDIENLVRGKASERRLVEAAFSSYQTTGWRKVDTLIVGVAARSHFLLNELRQLPRADRDWKFDYTLVIGHNGKDGADEALLTALNLLRKRPPPLPADYGQVVFATGDHAFVDTAGEVRREGASVAHIVGIAPAHGDWRAKVKINPRWIGRSIKVVFDELFLPDGNRRPREAGYSEETGSSSAKSGSDPASGTLP